jgi:hypothetical protein
VTHPGRTQADENALERLARAIPGYVGYREREKRAEVDRVVRGHVAARLEEARRELYVFAEKASRVGVLDALDAVERSGRRIEEVTARIRLADRGYARFLDAARIDEAVLDRVYRLDLSLISGVEEALAAAQAVEAAAGGIAPALAAFAGKLDALDTAVAERERTLAVSVPSGTSP